MEMIDFDADDDEAVHLGPDEKEVSVQKNAVTGIHYLCPGVSR
jgi:hypothetical protein